jgi:antitoxin YefM
MNHLSFTDLRQNLASTMDAVIADRVPVLVTRQGGKGNVVMLSEAEFAGWQETVHLLRSPANAAWLRRSVADADAGLAVEQALHQPG